MGETLEYKTRACFSWNLEYIYYLILHIEHKYTLSTQLAYDVAIKATDFSVHNHYISLH